MTTTTHTAPGPPTHTETPAEHLQATTAAVRVSFEWFGVRKTLSTDQKSQAAQPFGAEGQYLAASKKLLDTKHLIAITPGAGRIVMHLDQQPVRSASRRGVAHRRDEMRPPRSV